MMVSQHSEKHKIICNIYLIWSKYLCNTEYKMQGVDEKGISIIDSFQTCTKFKLCTSLFSLCFVYV